MFNIDLQIYNYFKIFFKQKNTQLQKKLPVTLLSGFLGSGKTTLLKHILQNKQNLKCAVIVNDMAALNIDAKLVKDGKLIQTQEKMVEMQNGCICCTLREDLLQEVAAIAKQNEFDYLIIESTGISEPLQVAETFTFNPTDMDVESLKDLSTLDTCVTVVDCTNFFQMFQTYQSLPEKFIEEKPSQSDIRTVSELMVDQLEFANVIVINKIDLVTKEEKESVIAAIKRFNKDAIIIESQYCNVDLKQILNTGLFNFEQAEQNTKWLGTDRYQLVPETVEYGITHFIYRRSRPFHNLRIYKLLDSNFYCYIHLIGDPLQDLDEDQQMDTDQEEEEENTQVEQIEQDEEAIQNKQEEKEVDNNETAQLSVSSNIDRNKDDHKNHQHQKYSPFPKVISDQKNQEEIPEEEQKLIEQEAQEYKKQREEALLQKNKGPFKDVWRSKGFFWICTNKEDFWNWSQSGIVNQIKPEGKYGCALNEELQKLIPDYEELKQGWDPVVGDREISLVFIGKDIDQTAIETALDQCLVTNEEWQEMVKNDLILEIEDDPFIEDEEEDDEEEDDEEEEIEEEGLEEQGENEEWEDEESDNQNNPEDIKIQVKRQKLIKKNKKNGIKSKQ